MPSDEDVLKQAGMIAGEQLVILKSSGKKVPTLIGIGQPIADGDFYRCKVFFTEMGTARDIVGATSLHALCLAIAFLKMHLKEFQDTLNWKYFHTEEGSGLPSCHEELEFDIDLWISLEWSNSKAEKAT